MAHSPRRPSIAALVLAALAAGYRFVVVPWLAAGNQQEQATEAYDALAARADAALYRAKNNGRNRVSAAE